MLSKREVIPPSSVKFGKEQASYAVQGELPASKSTCSDQSSTRRWVVNFTPKLKKVSDGIYSVLQEYIMLHKHKMTNWMEQFSIPPVEALAW